MANLYFFKNDGRCRFIKKFFSEQIKYLNNSTVNKEGKIIDYYLNLEWVGSGGMGVNKDFLNLMKIRYVNNIDELPEGAGLFISSYDGDLLKIKELEKKNIPILYEGICPWATAFKRQLLKVTDSHQCIILIDESHLLYRNYISIIPQNTIIVNEKNYKEKLKEAIIRKPIYFITYATFRKKEALKIIEYININYPNPDNYFYIRTLCSWSTQQGLFEEIQDKLNKKELDEMWILCNDDKNRSVKSIINEIEEYTIKTIIISDIADIPKDTENKNIGIIIAPIPFSKEKMLLNEIKKAYC